MDGLRERYEALQAKARKRIKLLTTHLNEHQKAFNRDPESFIKDDHVALVTANLNRILGIVEV